VRAGVTDPGYNKDAKAAKTLFKTNAAFAVFC
jgi:hypothetical protein